MLDAGGQTEFRLRKAAEDGGGTAFADLVWKPVVLVEMKKRGTDLQKHFRQAFDYWTRLTGGRPRYVVLCNFDEFWVYDFDSDLDAPKDKLALTDLPQRWGPLAFLAPGSPGPKFLYDREAVISKHVRNIFEDGELRAEATVAKIATVQTEGERKVSRDIEFYKLDVIISVGYRVKSHQGTQFRIWATQRLREYIIKGFALDDERLKRGGGGNYFDELLARIRDIRSSEKVFWRKALDLYATSIDYDPTAEASQEFFATVQNKMHWAAHGQTAAEVRHN